MKKTSGAQEIKKKIILLLLLISTGGYAQGDLLVYPKKITFEDTQERIKILNFLNEGADTATYRLSYIENRMTEKGELEILESPDEGQRFASPFLRFYPRRITLAPGETQTVKIQLTRTSELEPGEYRSHLYIRAEETTKALEEKEPTAEAEGELGIKLTAIYGLTIPNFIKMGNPEVGAEINNLNLTKENDTAILSMQVNRSGKRSVYGTLNAIYVSPQGKETFVAKQGMVIYAPTELQIRTMKLPAPEGVDYGTGTLKVTYTDQENEDALLASVSLEL